MIMAKGKDSGGIFGGTRGILNLNSLVSQPFRLILLVLPQYIVANHNLWRFIDGLSYLNLSFFVPLSTLFFNKNSLKLSKFCQNICEPFQGIKMSLKRPFCFLVFFVGITRKWMIQLQPEAL